MPKPVHKYFAKKGDNSHWWRVVFPYRVAFPAAFPEGDSLPPNV